VILRTEYGCKYVKDLPVAAVKVRYITGAELLMLQAGKRKWTTENLELRGGLPLLIHSESSGKYWYRILRKDHSLAYYRKYIKDGNLYIIFDDYWKDAVVRERDEEGMGYFEYNKIRHLILLDEALDATKDRSDGYQIKKRAIQIEIDKVKDKYK